MKGKKKELANQIAVAVKTRLGESGEQSKKVRKIVEKTSKKLAEKIIKTEIKAAKKIKKELKAKESLKKADTLVSELNK